MDGSCASSQSGESFLSLMLAPGGVSREQPVPGCLTAATALPSISTHCMMPGAGKAACAEQQPRGSRGPCLEASLEPADSMLNDMFMPGVSVDGSADWFQLSAEAALRD